MRLQVIAVGRLKAGPERDLADRYRTRAAALGRTLGFAGPDIVECPESRARRPEDRMAEEAVRLHERCGEVPVVVLDAGAPPLGGSEAFASRIAAARDTGGSGLAFLVGGPDGLAPDLKAGGTWAVSFGALTLPHGLVRVLLLEQLYRALTIMAGHPYHRSGGG